MPVRAWRVRKKEARLSYVHVEYTRHTRTLDTPYARTFVMIFFFHHEASDLFVVFVGERVSVCLKTSIVLAPPVVICYFYRECRGPTTTPDVTAG